MTDDELEKIYRPSATLIIAAKSSSNEHGYNYQFLLAKRSAAIAFAPDHYVFPGGVFDPKADENIEWLGYFKTFGISKEDLNKLSLQNLPNRPTPLMTNGHNLGRDISLRITAIREAFEEVGLLLCLNREDLKNKHKISGSFKHNFDRSHWQQRVHNNAMEFLNLCKHMDVVPDLWSLHEWSVWRSPPTARKKYDTAIYVVTLEDQPKLLLEPTEVEKELWATPPASLKLYKDSTIWLAPMQFYEISRLSNALDWSKLQAFVKERNFKGSTLIMLAYYRCTDYLVGTLPGDDYYPKNTLEHTETLPLSCSVMEFKKKTKNIHRITYLDMYDLCVTSNITPIDGHLSPVLNLLDNSKL
ncbi:acyl-coenzyme A diphosphatase NUDT19 [Calliphora vicina]|uniref:acyl-coenzyme A diphosphatase NUDT19 n=1 Tax=Calliphora vicina TaxID=7373 RepID=UPI00325AD059